MGCIGYLLLFQILQLDLAYYGLVEIHVHANINGGLILKDIQPQTGNTSLTGTERAVMKDRRQHEETHHKHSFGARNRYKYKGSGLRRDFRTSARRSGVERRVNDIKWCVSVDEDCNPITGIAHLMYLCDDWDCCDLELRCRHPRCGQEFGVGWMHDDATDKHNHCKKCEHNNRRSDKERRDK